MKTFQITGINIIWDNWHFRLLVVVITLFCLFIFKFYMLLFGEACCIQIRVLSITINDMILLILMLELTAFDFLIIRPINLPLYVN